MSLEKFIRNMSKPGTIVVLTAGVIVATFVWRSAALYSALLPEPDAPDTQVTASAPMHSLPKAQTASAVSHNHRQEFRPTQDVLPARTISAHHVDEEDFSHASAQTAIEKIRTSVEVLAVATGMPGQETAAIRMEGMPDLILGVNAELEDGFTILSITQAGVMVKSDFSDETIFLPVPGGAGFAMDNRPPSYQANTTLYDSGEYSMPDNPAYVEDQPSEHSEGTQLIYPSGLAHHVTPSVDRSHAADISE